MQSGQKTIDNVKTMSIKLLPLLPVEIRKLKSERQGRSKIQPKGTRIVKRIEELCGNAGRVLRREV